MIASAVFSQLRIPNSAVTNLGKSEEPSIDRIAIAVSFDRICRNSILNDAILGKSGYLYSLIEDHSHGGLRTSKGYTEDALIECCKTVVGFILSKYPGQVEEVKSLSER